MERSTEARKRVRKWRVEAKKGAEAPQERVGARGAVSAAVHRRLSHAQTGTDVRGGIDDAGCVLRGGVAGRRRRRLRSRAMEASAAARLWRFTCRSDGHVCPIASSSSTRLRDTPPPATATSFLSPP